MQIGKYYKVVNPVKMNSRLIEEGRIVYCYHKVKDEYWFRDIKTNSLACVLDEASIKDKLVWYTQVDKLNLLNIHYKDILQSMVPMYDYVTVEEQQITKDLANGKIKDAYYKIMEDWEVIKTTLLGEELRIHCINIY